MSPQAAGQAGQGSGASSSGPPSRKGASQAPTSPKAKAPTLSLRGILAARRLTQELKVSGSMPSGEARGDADDFREQAHPLCPFSGCGNRGPEGVERKDRSPHSLSVHCVAGRVQDFAHCCNSLCRAQGVVHTTGVRTQQKTQQVFRHICSIPK